MWPTVPATPSQYSVIFYCLLLLFVSSGVLCLIIGYSDLPSERVEEAFESSDFGFAMTKAKLVWLGYGLITIAVTMYITRKILRRL